MKIYKIYKYRKSDWLTYQVRISRNKLSRTKNKIRLAANAVLALSTTAFLIVGCAIDSMSLKAIVDSFTVITAGILISGIISAALKEG